MKDIVLNSLMFAISIITVNLYLWYVKKRCGRCSSISRSVKYLTKVNEVALFYLFVTFGICFPLGYLVYNIWAGIAIGIFSMISIITGYNPNINNDKLEDFLHVFCVNVAIILSVIAIMATSKWMSLEFIIKGGIIIVYIIICFFLWILKVKDHTWRIEVLVIYMIWSCLIFDNILNFIQK